MKTSVIITTYNRPEALTKVLNGLRDQTRAADEIIVADDGSEPETLETVCRFQRKFSQPLCHIWHEDEGFRAAEIRNKAILKSTGDYIILLDGDCIPAKYFIGDHLALAENGCFVQGKRVLVNKRLANRFTHEYTKSALTLMRYVFTRDISNRHHLIRMPYSPAFYSSGLSGIRSCNMGFFRRDIFAVNGFNQNFVGWGREDSELAVRFLGYGLKRKEHPFMAVCFHLWHEENDRKRLAGNDELFRKTVNSNEYICSNGLIQHRKEGR
ncbi:MAG: glycosyltransferase family 2 protein [Pseudomonadota bacterium]